MTGNSERIDFFRFPHTPHLAWLGKGSARDDKVFDVAEATDFLKNPVLIEEKIDGANLGFSLTASGDVVAQNRGQYLPRPFTGQFKRLNSWIAQREDRLFEVLGVNLILFGEWSAIRHSIPYDELPDWFVVFDVYDRVEKKFWSSARRDALATSLELPSVRKIAYGTFQLKDLEAMVMKVESCYRKGLMEGIVIRQENDDFLMARSKLVRSDFVQNIGPHWRDRVSEWNSLAAKT